MNIFEKIDLGGIQRLIYPVVTALGGPDIEALVEGKAEAMHEAAAAISAVAGLVDMVGDAMEDGIIDMDELNAIIAKAGTLDEAYEAVRVAVFGAPGGL